MTTPAADGTPTKTKTKKSWAVGAGVAASTHVGNFEAETPQAAIELARRKAGVKICWQCSEQRSDLELTHFYATSEEEIFDEGIRLNPRV